MLMQDQAPGVARDFSPSQLPMLTLTVPVQPLCAIAYINICMHVKNPNHTIVWTYTRIQERVAHYSCCCLPNPSKVTRISHRY